MKPKLVGVVPAGERSRRNTLFNALEEAFAVRFEGREADSLGALDAAIFLPGSVPPEDAPRRSYVALTNEPGHAEAADVAVELATGPAVDRRLRGARPCDAAAATAPPLRVDAGAEVLATGPDGPVWTASGDRRTAALAPLELDDDEALRNRLAPERWLALLPLVDFLRGLTADIAWSPPPLRACFLVDDPNLHWRSYGFISYPELLRHADEHDYHVALATVPLDAWFVSRSVARVFRDRPDRLSLVFHGNDHVREELARPRESGEVRALLAQAIRRMQALEHRSGVRVERVMAAPHGVCSEQTARELLLLGFEGLAISRPYPWLAVPPLSWLERPVDSSPLAAWEPSTLVAGGLPILLRRPFQSARAELALRAYLDQPLVLYGHHGDLANGLDVLAEQAREIARLGDVSWQSLGEIGAGNVTTRREGSVLALRIHGRRARVHLPEGVESVRVELPAAHGRTDGDGVQLALGGLLTDARPGEEVVLPEAGARKLELTLTAQGAVDPAHVRSPRPAAWPIARRAAGEARDRFVAVYRRRPPRSYAPTS